MNWLMLTDEKQLAELDQLSYDVEKKGILLFKHSTICSTSSMALNRLERNWNISSEILPAYFLDLLNYRSISAEIAAKYAIRHESPQVLIIKNGKCIYTTSHSGISFDNIKNVLFNQPK